MVPLEEKREGIALPVANAVDDRSVGNHHATLTHWSGSRSHLAGGPPKSPPLACPPPLVHCSADLNPMDHDCPRRTSTSAPPTSAKPASLWEDFIDIFVSP